MKITFQVPISDIMNKPYYLPSILLPVLILVNSFFFAAEAFAQCEPIGPITSGSGTFVVPEGITSITVEVWGGGGKGGRASSNNTRSGGGGGGAYSQSVFSVTPGQTFNYSVGAGSTSNNNTPPPGGDTWFGSNTTLMAKGGSSVNTNNLNGAAGGQASAGYGELRYNGGNGSNASNSGSIFSGGGGSSASSLGNGINATSNTGATALIGGGDGGDGTTGNGNTNGQDGEAPGGGGGGARRNNQTRNGGNGGNGQIIITYTCPCFTVLDNGSLSGVTIIQFNGNCAWEAPEGLLDFEVLVVGGGGGGGYGNGGGGGGGGIVHARVDVEARLVSGLPAGSIFQIQVGSGGDGSTGIDIQGGTGVDSSFDLDGLYEIVAGGGGGGGSEDEGDGEDGQPSSFNSATSGLSSLFLRGGSGGGGADGDDISLGGQEMNSLGNGGNSIEDESGSGGGGAGGNGQDSDDEDGGNGGDGEPFSIFDIFSNRVFGAGGGGGGQGDLGNGGSGGSGGAGGEGEEDDDPLSERIGRNATTPGSGGGGGAEEAAGGNGARGMVFIGYANSRILPVEYVSLEAEFSVEERQTELTWTTSMERENSHFEVQRSTDGLKSWEVIGNVDGMGWSDAPVNYRFEDVNPSIAGGTVYYRLNQVDFDGTSTLSKVLSVKVPGVQFTQGVWRAYPNPTSGEQLRVSLLDKSQYSGEDIAFKIIHPTSISKAVSVTSENEMNEAISQMIRNVPKGVFVIELTWGQKIEHIKVLKK